MYINNVLSSLLFNTVPGPEDAEYSCASWKRVPTTLEVIFALALPYTPPASPLGAFLWRKRVWFESTFALTMLQPWEKLCLLIVIHSSWILLLTAIVLYFPNEWTYLIIRGRYYLFGEEPAAAASVVDAAATKLSATAAATATRVLVEL